MTRDQFCEAVNTKRPYFYAIYERDTKKVLESGVTPAYGERVSVENWVGIQMYKYGGTARCCKRVKPDESHLFDGLQEEHRKAEADRIADELGAEISFAAAVALMDDEIREAVHNDLAPCTNQAFFDEYCKRHMDKYGEAFEV